MSRPEIRRVAACAAVALAACGPAEPLSYTALVAQRIQAELPGARVEPAGHDLRAKLGTRVVNVDVGEIEMSCRRGPRDCERAIGRVVIELADGGT